jgi:Ankyrin repeats (3 copies)
MIMAATVKQLITPDADAAELWRVAESGDVDELLRVLPRISNLNVRNRHGMTALMKAAFHGHEPVARTLLEHGADPNLARNDKFTALALAAFFGHTETVKTLIEFGARADVITRCGASAFTWAAARTFSDVAQCIQRHAPTQIKLAPVPEAHAAVPVPETYTPSPEAYTPAAVAPVVVKTLKEPPEIWDLVHEAPRNFNARSAFVSRITTMNRTVALALCAGLILLVACGVGAFVLTRSNARNLVIEIPPLPTAAATAVSEPVPQQAVTENPPVEVVNENHSRSVPNKSRLLIPQRRSTFSSLSQGQLATAPSREAPAVAGPQFESPKPAQPTAKTPSVNPLSPNLIAPAKNAPPKAKVIQWP